MTAPAPRRGRPPKLSRAQVVDCALQLVLQEGYDAVTLRRLAAELNVSTFAVHSHMGSKDDLLDDVVLALLAERGEWAGRTRTWQKALTAYATTMFEMLLEHPTVLDVLQRRATAPESVLVELDRIATLAEMDGVGAVALAEVYEVVWAFVLGYAATVHARHDVDERGQREQRAAAIADELPSAAGLARALAATDRRKAFPARLLRLVEALGASA